jgi:uridylate kinase
MTAPGKGTAPGKEKGGDRQLRVLLKLSGEILGGEAGSGIDPAVLDYLADEIRQVRQGGAEIGIVLGGGNLFRGQALAAAGMDRVVGDHMGMLATVMNALAFQDALHRHGIAARTLSAIPMGGVCETYSRARAVRHLEKGHVTLLAAGTGNPFFTTDTAASLRAIEIGADLLIKATKVDGIYSADPKRDPTAQRFDALTYDEVLTRRLEVMDQTAIVLCRDQRLPLRIVDLTRSGALARAARGEREGTVVTQG